jgi:CIC family chloride channel protein
MHQGFPVVDGGGHLMGVVTRRDLSDPALGDDVPMRRTIKRAAVVIYADNTLWDAAGQLVHERVG